MEFKPSAATLRFIQTQQEASKSTILEEHLQPVRRSRSSPTVPLTHLLDVTDPVKPPSSHISGQAMGCLSCEHSQGPSLRTIHPGPLQGHAIKAVGVHPEHQTGGRGGKNPNVYQPVPTVLVQISERKVSNEPLHGYEHQIGWADVFLQHRGEALPIGRLHVDRLGLQVGPEQVPIQPITG